MSIALHKATGNGNVAETITPSGNFQIEGFYLHLSAAGGANNITITIDDGDGSAYDVVLFTQDMTAITNLSWIPFPPYRCKKLGTTGTSVVIAWTNGSSRTWGLKLLWSPIP